MTAFFILQCTKYSKKHILKYQWVLYTKFSYFNCINWEIKRKYFFCNIAFADNKYKWLKPQVDSKVLCRYRQRFNIYLKQQCVHAWKVVPAQLCLQFVHLVPRVRAVERKPVKHASQQPQRQQELVLVVALQQWHTQPEQLSKNRHLIICAGWVSQQLQGLSRPRSTQIRCVLVQATAWTRFQLRQHSTP